MAEVGKQKGGIGAWLRNVPVFVQQVKAETAKVAWPSWPETWKTAMMVVIMTLILSVFFFSVDWGFSRIVRFLLSLVER